MDPLPNLTEDTNTHEEYYMNIEINAEVIYLQELSAIIKSYRAENGGTHL